MPPVHHVGRTVSDLDACVAFYRDVLGLAVLDRFSVAGEEFATGVGVPDASAEFVHLDGDGVRVELVEYEPEGADCTPDAVNQSGAGHLGVSVPDVEAFYADLPDGVETVSDPRTTASGTTIGFLRDPEGNLVEVLET